MFVTHCCTFIVYIVYQRYVETFLSSAVVAEWAKTSPRMAPGLAGAKRRKIAPGSCSHPTGCLGCWRQHFWQAKLNCLSPQLQGLSLTYPQYIKSLTFLNKISNLKQLNLSGMSLQTKLPPLRYLPSGLLYLKLDNCYLTGYDLKILRRSHHINTLLQLNISNQNFQNLFNASELIELCQDLVAIEILEIENCNLDDHLGLLLESLAVLPKLSLLSLCSNGFLSSSFLTHADLLNNYISLKCIKLTLPTDLETDIHHFKSKLENKINCNRKSYLHVIWNSIFFKSAPMAQWLRQRRWSTAPNQSWLLILQKWAWIWPPLAPDAQCAQEGKLWQILCSTHNNTFRTNKRTLND